MEAILIEELDRVAREGITDEELTKAKAQLKARLVFDNDSITNIAHQFGYFETIARVDVYFEMPSRIAAVTLDQVSRAAHQVLQSIEPHDRLVRSARAGAAVTLPVFTRSSGDPRTGLAPARAVLPHGVVVIAKETGTIPAVTISLVIRAGSIHDPADAPGAVHLLSRVIDRGTATRSAATIAEDLDSRGIALAVGVTRHAVSLVCSCLAEDFEPVFALLGDIVMSPSFPADELGIRKAEVTTAIRQDEDNPAVRATESLMGLLYPDPHPYGRRIKGTSGAVEALTRERLVRAAREALRTE